MLLKKGELHKLIAFVAPESIDKEVAKKLDLLKEVFDVGRAHEENVS